MIMETVQKKRRVKAILPGVILSGAAGFMFFLYAPLELYFSNKNEFWFDFYTLIPVLLVGFAATAILGSLGFLVLYLIHERLYQTGLVACFIAYIASYIQGNFLVKNLPPLDGTEVDWSMYSAERIKSIAVWVVVITSVLIAIRFARMEKFANIIKYIPICLSLMMTAALVTVCINNNGLERKRIVLVSDEKLYEMSDDTNFIIFVLDAADARFVTPMLEENPDYREIFEDFTYYPNTVGAYPFTMMAIPHILSGEWFENEEPFWDYNVNAFKNAPLFAALENKGYRMGLYEADLPGNDDSVKRFENVQDEASVSNYWEFFKAELRLTGFKYAPFDLKRFAIFDMNFFDSLQERGFDYGNLGFYHKMLQEPVTHTKDKCFKFIHIEGAHVPFQYNEKVELIQGGSYEENLKACMTITRDYLEKLKAENVYDNSVIIVMADHGYAANVVEDDYTEYIGRSNPILFVKGVGESHDMKVSNAPISFVDLQEAYARLLDGNGGDSVFDAAEGQKRERRHLLYRYLREDYIYEYVQTGEAWDTSTLMPTGVEYIREGAE